MIAISPNEQQLQAIEASSVQAVRVLAGAGTGKTQVISQRYVYLLHENPLWRPDNILVLTFSEKAATEMRARIFRAVRESALGFNRLDLAGAPISTFHSFGARLLRENSLRVGISAGSAVLSEIDVAERMDLLREEFFESGYLTAYGDEDPLSLDAYSWENGEPFELARNIVVQLLNQAVPPSDLRNKNVLDELSSPEIRTLVPVIDWLYGRYLEMLQSGGLLDFDRLIVGAAELLNNDGALGAAIRREFKAILVDEYQDTNYAQDKLLKALATERMADAMVVGDPRQAIYVWREARVENIANFPGDGQPPSDFPLVENYRSLVPILTAANHAIAGYEFGEPEEFPAAVELKPTHENQAFEGTVVQLQALPTREEEAQAVAAWIGQSVTGGGWNYRDIAVLIRARTYLPIYTAALDAAGIPYELSAGDAFYSRPEILDAVHRLNVCLDPTNELSLVRVLLSPFIGLSQAEVAAIKQRGKPLWAAVKEKGSDIETHVSQRLERLIALYDVAQRERWKFSAAELMDRLLWSSGLMELHDESARRALTKLLAIVHNYEAQHPTASLLDVCQNLIILLKSEQPEKAPELNTDANAVRIMTVHASKGLEFPVVLVIDSRQKCKPSRDLAPFYDPETGLVIPKRNEEDERFLERVRRTRNEARCLWYVSLTRAKKRLVVTATNDTELDNGVFPTETTFFEELWNRIGASPVSGIELGPSTPQADLSQPGPPASTPSDFHPIASVPSGRVHAYGKPQVRVSPTAFLTYQNCPAAYRFAFLAGLGRSSWYEENDADSREGALLGTLFHRLAAAAATSDKVTFDDLFLAQLDGLEPIPNAEQKQQLRLWFEDYLHHPIGRVHLAPNQVEVRLSSEFEFEKGKLLLHGRADRLEPMRLMDFKTDADADALVERYGDQVRLYAMMARRTGLLKDDAELILYHVPTNTPLQVSFDRQHESRLLGELEVFTAAVLQPDATFQAHPGDICRWCQARESICRAGQDWAQQKGW